MALLSVRVLDAHTNEPVPFVAVIAEGPVRDQGLTGPDGVASFDLPPGDYLVRVRSPVHSPWTGRLRCPGSYDVRVARAVLWPGFR